MRYRQIGVLLAMLGLLGALILSAPVAAVASANHGVRLTVTRVGTTTISTRSFTPTAQGATPLGAEFAGEGVAGDTGAGPNPYGGVISLAPNNRAVHGASSNSANQAKSNPTFQFGFQGLNHYQQRYARGGNQFSVEPPDQGMCVGNGYVLETVNDVMNVFDASDGTSALPDNTSTNIVSGYPRDVNHAVDLNSFYGYPPAINRSTGVRGQFVTDPSCIYDAQTDRFFNVVLTLETNPTTGAFTTVNHLDLAVSQTGNPTGLWNIYRIDVTNDGTNTGGSNPGPYLGDYPHIGADANGVYLTTNAYPWCCNGFGGAQIYALSKSELAAGALSVNMVHIDTSGMVNAPSDAGATQPGFTVWPAQSPGSASFNSDNGGTEYFLSSNAASEATHPVSGAPGSYTSSQIVEWTLTNSSSLDTTPDLSLSSQLVSVNEYALPPKQQQPGSGGAPGTNAPLGHCINNKTTYTAFGTRGCWTLLFGSEPAHHEVVSTPDSNDTRMQQVDYANGDLWGALDTAVTVGGTNRAGIAWFVLNPGDASVVKQGTYGAAGWDFVYPAIGVTAAGHGEVAFTATGDRYPSAAYAPIDATNGMGAWNIVPGGLGAAQDDGFTSYVAEVGSPPRTRWGDYGAASVSGSNVWLASEYIGGACNYPTWGGPFFAGGTGDNLLGSCAGASHGPGVRTALANWSTFISEFTP